MSFSDVKCKPNFARIGRKFQILNDKRGTYGKRARLFYGPTSVSCMKKDKPKET